MKYSSFLLTASIWVFTVLCVSVTNIAAQGVTTQTDADFFNGNLETAFQEFSKIDESSNIILKLFRDMANKYIDSFDKDKKQIQYAVTKGTEMEKKIQSILQTLKNSTIPLSTELQSDVKEIEKHAATELKKLEGMENVNDIDAMQKECKEKYEEIKQQFKEISDLYLALINKTSTSDNTATKSTKFHSEIKPKLIEFLRKFVSFMFTAKKDTDTISNKLEITSSALSKIRDGLIKLEQMEYHLLLSQKHFKTDAAPWIRSPFAQFVFAILFAMLF